MSNATGPESGPRRSLGIVASVIGWFAVLFIGAIAVLGALSPVLGGPSIPEAVDVHSRAFFLVALAGLFSSIALVLWQWHQASRLLRWLGENEGLLGDGLSYDGFNVGPDTEVVRYRAVVSLLLFSFRLRSRFFFVGQERSMHVAVLYSLFTVLFGWWFFPWGPLWTTQALVDNLGGRHRGPIKRLLLDPERPAARQTFAQAMTNVMRVFLALLSLSMGVGLLVGSVYAMASSESPWWAAIVPSVIGTLFIGAAVHVMRNYRDRYNMDDFDMFS